MAKAPKTVPQTAPAPETVEPEKSPNIVTNCLEGTTLSLGDGRSISFGESAEVSEELAAFLRERGQVE